MASRKYLNDYEIVKYVDSKGRTKSEAVYIGGDYAVSPPVPKADKLIMGCLCALAVLCFVCALFPATRAARTTYVMVPFVFTPVSLYIMSVAIIALLRAKDVMTRYDADRISKRLSPAAMVSAFLPAAAVIGLIIAILRSAETFQPGDLLFFILSMAIVLSSAVVFKKSLKVKIIKLEKRDIEKLPE